MTIYARLFSSIWKCQRVIKYVADVFRLQQMVHSNFSNTPPISSINFDFFLNILFSKMEYPVDFWIESVFDLKFIIELADEGKATLLEC